MQERTVKGKLICNSGISKSDKFKTTYTKPRKEDTMQKLIGLYQKYLSLILSK